MGFDNTLFPTDISYGSSGGPGFSSRYIELDSRKVVRVQRTEVGVHKFNVAYQVKSQSTLSTLKKFYLARNGGANTFPFKDWTDYASNLSGTLHFVDDDLVTKDDVIIGTGDNTTVAFQLIKIYADTIQDYVRNIILPVQGTLLVALDGVLKTEGVDYTVNYITGIITFTIAPAATVTVTAGFEYYVPVFFGEGADGLLDATIQDFSSRSFGVLDLIEDVTDLPVPDRANPGGTKIHTASATDVDITLAEGRVHIVSPTAGGTNAILQRADDIGPGAPIFYIVNDGTFSLDVKNETGNLLITLAVNAITEILLSIDSGGAKSYLAK